VLAVNVSGLQFRQIDFITSVQSAVQKYGIKPSLLKLELTESMLMGNIDEAIAKMNTLNEIGIQFSLDDFGTGYSSMQYLKRLPLDQIKIDQSFVRDLETDNHDRAIVRTIIAMARSLNLDVIAEGVETTVQQQLLIKKGCTQFQGYLFGKPLPIEQLDELLNNDWNKTLSNFELKSTSNVFL
jgi:EAL domain-containing protein (putative c-di-GMP-specific phosphodiesterase class I)